MNYSHYPLYLANAPLQLESRFTVYDKYSGEPLADVSLADRTIMNQAMEAAVSATIPCQKMPAVQRRNILLHCVKGLRERANLLTELLCREVGKPLRDAKSEVARLINTFELAAEESRRLYGEVLPLDVTEAGVGYMGFWKRFPIGPCLFISPFNFPLNLPAHKIAPAIAVGCPFILKPASLTPLFAIMLGEILAETDLPKGAFSILPAKSEDAEIMVRDDRLKLLSFTGSASVGWKLKAIAGKKQVILELGGNAACILDENIDLDHAADRLVFGAFYQGGQSCISVQRIYAHESIYEDLKQKMLDRISHLQIGNPLDPHTSLGPLISEKEAIRVIDWVESAIEAGAKLICGGTRTGSIVTATLLENVPKDHKLNSEEVFGPVAICYPFRDFNAAIEEVNDSRYGLQAGVFTRDLYKSQIAWETLEVGGVIINDVPSYRSDHMPYGGIKDSGIGREGLRFAIEHLTEIRMLVIKLVH